MYRTHPSHPSSPATLVIPAKAGISDEGAGQESHEIPAFAGMTSELND